MPYFNVAYPTRDHIIPWTLFVLMYADLPRLNTWHQLRESASVAHGIATQFDGEKAAAVSRAALDEVYPPDAPDA